MSLQPHSTAMFQNKCLAFWSLIVLYSFWDSFIFLCCIFSDTQNKAMKYLGLLQQSHDSSCFIIYVGFVSQPAPIFKMLPGSMEETLTITMILMAMNMTDGQHRIVLQTWEDQQWWQNFRVSKATFLEICAMLPMELQNTFVREALSREACGHHYLEACHTQLPQTSS